jgi:hypothetical protein
MSTGLERQYIQYVFLTSNNMGKEIKLKEPELKALLEKIEKLLNESFKTDYANVHDAANEVYYYLNEKFAKYLD